MKDRNKNLNVYKIFLNQRLEMQERIQSKARILFRVNRSIQVEGEVGVLNQDMGFRLFLLRESAKVQTEMLLLCLEYNIKKFHNKIQSKRCGVYLHISKTA